MRELSATPLTELLCNMNKSELRIWAKEKRKELDMAQISTVLADKLVQTEEYKNSKNIMLFYPLENEVNLLSLLGDNTKYFYLPRVKENELECCPYSLDDKLAKSDFNISEPLCKACSKQEIDLVIVPALACDKNGYRLGYGGGFYDRFLQDFGGIKICCIPQELLLDNIFPEKHDVKMHLIICGK